MTKTPQNYVTLVIGPVVLNWHALTKEQAARKSESLRAKGKRVLEDKYSVGVIIDPKTQQGLIQSLYQAVEEWKSKNPGFSNIRINKSFEVGANKDWPQHVAFDMNSSYAPHLYLRDGSDAPADVFYRGCVVVVGATIRKYDGANGPELTMSAQSVQFLNDGVPLGGGGVSRQAALQLLQSAGVQELPPGYNAPQPTVNTPTVSAAPAYGQPIGNGYQQPVYNNPGPGLQPPPVYNQPQYQAPSQGGL